MAKRATYGFGIIGCGMIAEFHARAIQAIRGAKLVACHDVDRARAEKLAATFGCDPFDDLDAFLAHAHLDIVTIGTPSGAHLDPAIRAIRARKHAIVEKPLEITLGRCDRMIREADRRKVALAGIFPSRFGEGVGTVKRAIASGRFGRLTLGDATVKWYRTQQYYDSGGWRGTWDLDGGGALMNQSIHTVDLVQWLMGPIAEVNAVMDCLIHKRIEVEDAAVAAIRYRSGAIGFFEGTTAAYPGLPKEIHVSGEKGTAMLRDDAITFWKFERETRNDDRIRQAFAPGKGPGAGAADPKAISFVGHQRQFEEFLGALRRGEKPLVDGREARKAVEIIIGIYLSAIAGRPATFPVRFSGSPGELISRRRRKSPRTK
ncbi:MAG: Gfo/Idh/MocA family oxidoreductase [Planctomycetes bacterium]|nr:Gfo/Idh/MocA family oxidoreductase [Planctomycetota bacterium]